MQLYHILIYILSKGIFAKLFLLLKTHLFNNLQLTQLYFILLLKHPSLKIKKASTKKITYLNLINNTLDIIF